MTALTVDTTTKPIREHRRYVTLFVIAAVWNFAGAIPGFFDPAGMFAREFGRELDDPVMTVVYRGAWGTALLYGLGFLVAARDPLRHTGIVLMGGLGKAFFALHLAYMYSQGWTSSFALLVIAGDIVFVAAFLAYFAWVHRSGRSIV